TPSNSNTSNGRSKETAEPAAEERRMALQAGRKRRQHERMSEATVTTYSRHDEPGCDTAVPWRAVSAGGRGSVAGDGNGETGSPALPCHMMWHCTMPREPPGSETSRKRTL